MMYIFYTKEKSEMLEKFIEIVFRKDTSFFEITAVPTNNAASYQEISKSQRRRNQPEVVTTGLISENPHRFIK